MCMRDKGKHTALCLTTRQAQNVQDFARSLCSGLIIGEMKVSPTAAPHGLLLGLCKASGGPDSPGTRISTPVKGFEYSGRDESTWGQLFCLVYCASTGIEHAWFCYLFYNVIRVRCSLSLPSPQLPRVC